MTNTSYMKIHQSYRNVVAVCDIALIGKKFEEGKRQLDVRENFFKGEEKDKEELTRTFRSQSSDDSTFNIVGETSINIAKEAGIISDDHIAHVDGIPFALVLV